MYWRKPTKLTLKNWTWKKLVIIKHFGKLSSYFSDKNNKSSKITLVEDNIAIANEKRVAELMKKYLINITKNSNLKAPIINTTDDLQSLTKNYVIILAYGK